MAADYDLDVILQELVVLSKNRQKVLYGKDCTVDGFMDVYVSELAASFEHNLAIE